MTRLPGSPGGPRWPRSVAGAVAGVLTAAAAIGVAQFVAGLAARQGSPPAAVAEAAIDLSPQPVKDFAISTFGSADKSVLTGGILVVLALSAAVIGVLAARRLAYGLCGLAVFTGAGLAAALTRPGASAAYAAPTLAGAAAGAVTLTWLIRAASGPRPAPAGGAAPQVPPTGAAPRATGTAPQAVSPGTPLPARAGGALVAWQPDRRRFLAGSGAALAAAAVGGIAGRELTTRQGVTQAMAALRFPAPARPAPPLPAGSDLRIPGLSPFITPDSSFYRVDTAIVLPEVAPQSWRLRIHGMVGRELDVTFAELLRQPLIEDYVTLTCVSNPVGGPYIGNAKWLGASLASLIRRARPRPGADQLLCTSADGFTSGTPLAVVLDGRDALLAVAMNGTALPVAHGFPARMVIPGLYGYVSATKWVTDIKVTTFAAESAYWVQRGWAQQAPIKTESRIDVPAGGAALGPGRIPVAGVAWAQHKGIAAVQVRVDRGPWHEARLAAVPDIDTWRQWVWYWDAAPGSHLIEARATDATGYTQTAAVTPTVPNGASGYPSVTVTVR